LLEELIKNDASMDGLNVGSSKLNTYTSSRTGVNSFLLFWNSFKVDPSQAELFFNVREKYAAFEDGFHALCSMSHEERNITLCHYVANGQKLDRKGKILGFLLGRTKRGYLNSIVRALKWYEQQHKLIEFYGDWSWTKSGEYNQLYNCLVNTTLENELNVHPNNLKGENLTDFMTDEAFEILHKFTLQCLVKETDFSQKLRIIQHYIMQDQIRFGCPRARKELAATLAKDFQTLNSESLLFQQTGHFKSARLEPDFRVKHKPSRILLGEELVKLVEMIADPAKRKNPEVERMYLRPLDGIKQGSQFWFGKRVQGEGFCAEAVSAYVRLYREQINPQFGFGEKWTNTSIRSCMLKSSFKPEHQCKLLKSRSGKIPRVTARAGMIGKTR
jgi:hypothetical protein